ncbi:MAG: DUF58 domain-containing protein [Phycisphaerales bacterium JB043]
MLTEELMQEVRRLQIRTRRRVDDLFSGEYHSAFKGQGVEFSEVREYQPGDDVRAIDWNVTARTGKPFVKRYQEERQLTIIIAVDRSASEGFGSGEKLKGQISTELAAVLTFVASRNNDRVGQMIFSDHVEQFVPPKKGRAHVLRLMRDLLDFEPTGTGTDLAGAISHLSGVLHRRSIVFLVSDFEAPVESLASVGVDTQLGFLTPLRKLASKHEVIAVRLTDPRERELPRVGILEVRDPETGQTVVLDTSSGRTRRAYLESSQDHHASVDRALRSASVDCIDISTDEPFVPALANYFHMREMRR